ncbi:MAG: PilZ domain-containing protein [Terriglobales bacterium]
MQSPYFQERKYRRFLMCYPVQVTFDEGDSVSELRAVSSNISLGGMLLEAATAIPQHCNVSFTLVVHENDVVGAFQLSGEGQVVRAESHQSGKGFSIAVECKRPISKLKAILQDQKN